ncbi:hypothetical protein [Ferroacidibacillus organovorans]|uniref:hypothetical protein n=1 Tax=Ferroacidibacillus organovorans TaxID=1765683 RepID=UPI00136659B9|nr:hypothetical protein [Ferroacidibacillus organovorans]
MLIWSGVLNVISAFGLRRAMRVNVGSVSIVMLVAFATGDVKVSTGVHSPYGKVLWS